MLDLLAFRPIVLPLVRERLGPGTPVVNLGFEALDHPLEVGLAVERRTLCGLGSGQVALQPGDFAVLLGNRPPLGSQLFPEPIRLGEVRRESLTVGPLPLRF